jgi:7,8-dihydropterin-6-yl-methyl-4-(beta-D-ribofuranosyl)aminobenzene 5'-phosphate synthase
MFTIAFRRNMQTETPFIKLSVLFNNVSFDPRLRTGWGFSCLIEGTKQRILFDTGDQGAILIDNMERMNIDPMGIDDVFLSHAHADHTGGLEAFLKKSPRVTVYMPESFPFSFKQTVESHGASVKAVGDPIQIVDRVYSIGEMGTQIKEQALVLRTSNGLVIITGCAHPGIADVVRRAKDLCNDDFYLVMGGFHLGGMTGAQVSEIIRTLKQAGVDKVAPSHCTGEKAIALFKNAWGDNFLAGGVGAIIEVPG